MSKSIDASSIKLSVDYGNGFEVIESVGDMISVDGDCLKIRIKCDDKAEKMRLTVLREYVLVYSACALNGVSQYVPFNSNGYAVKKGIFSFFDINPQLDFSLSEISDKNLFITINLIDFEDEKMYFKLLLNEHRRVASANKQLQSHCDELKEQNDEINKKYIEILNSFYWRVLALPRRFTTRIVIWARKHPPVAKFLSGVKRAIVSGPVGVIRKLRSKRSNTISIKISSSQRRKQQQTKFDKDIKFSVLVPLYNTPEKYLRQMIKSVCKQTYGNWELCLADGSDSEHSYVGEICKQLSQKDSRIVYSKLEKNLGISENTNACIDMATGDFIALFDHDDLLHPSALYEMMKAICEKNADFMYTDEVTFVGNNTSDIIVYHFKPDFAIDNLRANNYICHFSAFSRKLLEKVGKFNFECDGSQDYDMILRLTEKAEKIVHIPKALYFWRSHQMSVASDISAKPYVIDAAKKALGDHLKRMNIEGTVEQTRVASMYKINYKIKENPKISILIPNKDHIDDLELCIESILYKSTYENYEIIIIENNSTESLTFDYYKTLTEENENIKVVTWEGEFNYSAINNFGVRYAEGDYLLFLNNDVEIITPNWMEEMLMYAQREDVGAVGVKLYYPDDTVQHGGIGIGLLTLAGHYHRGFERLHPGYMGRLSYAHDVSAVTAACMMVRRDVFDEIGGFEERLKVAFNDVDLCMKIRQKDYLIVFTPFAELYHYESKSRGLDVSGEKRRRFVSEVELFHEKWDEILEKGDPFYNPNLTLDKEDFGLR